MGRRGPWGPALPGATWGHHRPARWPAPGRAQRPDRRPGGGSAWAAARRGRGDNGRGLSRLQDGQSTPVPFALALSFRGNPATLEAFFQALAQALFAAQPVTTVALGGVSFVEAFGSPLVKEDLIFSLAEDQQGRLWVGTLGGGLRRVEMRQGVPQDSQHLT